MGTSVARIAQITDISVQTATNQDNQAVDMNENIIHQLMLKAGTDVSGKWMNVENAEKFAQLVIEQYNKELREDRREIKSKLGYSRVGLNNV